MPSTPSACAISSDPPLLLYGKGAMPSFDDEAAIAVVGTRSCSPYGLRSAEHFGYSLAREGALVVSGLARGIDALGP
ncbi:MAG: DNA-processing protein DprA [Oscillospiraceae bacterium]